jgi:hypothetical protein
VVRDRQANRGSEFPRDRQRLAEVKRLVPNKLIRCEHWTLPQRLLQAPGPGGAGTAPQRHPLILSCSGPGECYISKVFHPLCLRSTRRA